LDFKTQAKASLSAVIISGSVGVYLAYNDYGVWALLVQYLVNTLLNTVFLWWLTPWFPLFKFSCNSLKYLFPFGVRLLFAGLFHSVYMNLYSLVIGRKYSVMDVGYFSQASLVARLPSVSLMAIISRAIYPIQCKISHDSVEDTSEVFIKYLRIASFVIFPMMIGLAVLSKSLILILLSDRWLPMSQYLFILCLSYFWIPLLVMNNQMLLVNDRTDLFLKM
jgi:O-antigen/teichoic acid export membrane protein